MSTNNSAPASPNTSLLSSPGSSANLSISTNKYLVQVRSSNQVQELAQLSLHLQEIHDTIFQQYSTTLFNSLINKTATMKTRLDCLKELFLLQTLPKCDIFIPKTNDTVAQSTHFKEKSSSSTATENDVESEESQDEESDSSSDDESILNQYPYPLLRTSLELFCFKTILDTQYFSFNLNRIKYLCLLCTNFQQETMKKLPVALEQFWLKKPLTEQLLSNQSTIPKDSLAATVQYSFVFLFQMLNSYSQPKLVSSILQFQMDSILRFLKIYQLESNNLIPFSQQSSNSFVFPSKESFLLLFYSLPLFELILLYLPQSLLNNLISSSSLWKELDEQWTQYLGSAGIISEKKKTGVLKLFNTDGISNSGLVLELDGSNPSSGFFTILNYSKDSYTLSQITSAKLFGMIHSILSNLYIPTVTNHTSMILWMDQSLLLIKSAMNYALRLLQQVELAFANPFKLLFSMDYVEAVTCEGIQILNSICLLKPSIIASIILPLKKFFTQCCEFNLQIVNLFPHLFSKSVWKNSSVPQQQQAKQKAPIWNENMRPVRIALLYVLRFVIQHSDSNVFESQFFFHRFFSEQFSICCRDSLFVMEYIILCLEQPKTIFFEEHYIFKWFQSIALHPSLYQPYSNIILNQIINQNSSIIPLLLHRIIDLPHLCKAVEKSNIDSKYIQQCVVIEEGKNLIEFWNQPSIQNETFTETSNEQRIEMVIQVCCLMLNTLFTYSLQNEEICVTLITPLLIRLKHSTYIASALIQTNLMSNLYRLITKYSTILFSFKEIVLQLLQAKQNSSLTSLVVYWIGLSVSKKKKQISQTDIKDYLESCSQFFEQLELMLVERIAHKRTYLKMKQQQDSKEEFKHLDTVLSSEELHSAESFNLILSCLLRISNSVPELLPKFVNILKLFKKSENILDQETNLRVREVSLLVGEQK